MGADLLSIVAYVDGNTLKVSEHVVDIRDAADDKPVLGHLKLLELSLEEMNISLDGVVSQTYDGASVMSGHIGGEQKLLRDLC